MNGVWLKDPARLHFSESQVVRPTFSSNKFKKLKEGQISALVSFFLESEIKQAIQACEGSKALGPNGFIFTFSKAHQETIKFDVIAFVKEFEANGRISKG